MLGAAPPGARCCARSAAAKCDSLRESAQTYATACVMAACSCVTERARPSADVGACAPPPARPDVSVTPTPGCTGSWSLRRGITRRDGDTCAICASHWHTRTRASRRSAKREAHHDAKHAKHAKHAKRITTKRGMRITLAPGIMRSRTRRMTNKLCKGS